MHKILVIEENCLLLEMIAELLMLSRFRVLTSSSHQEGYEFIELEKPDLILCNYPLLELGDLIILQQICHDAAKHNIPLLFMLGYNIQIIEWQTLVGQQEVLVKPFNSRILLEKIHALIQSRQNFSPVDLTLTCYL